MFYPMNLFYEIDTNNFSRQFQKNNLFQGNYNYIILSVFFSQ